MAAVVWNGSILWDQPQNAGVSASSTNAQVAVCEGLIAGIGGGRGGMLRHPVQCPIGKLEPMNRIYASIAFYLPAVRPIN
jgi:hypothetical protein